MVPVPSTRARPTLAAWTALTVLCHAACDVQLQVRATECVAPVVATSLLINMLIVVSA